jgi:hypothetical protein
MLRLAHRLVDNDIEKVRSHGMAKGEGDESNSVCIDVASVGGVR